ncbi:Sulfiredoxin, chloroplastic/mitochondrial [Mucuna pruriens]|uniref:sulfiredoxin n=1 Tax=Mucuna pruriens TaxID=157652 RepID=A0A371G466_MUCPR|nr:Sulfiredoxin, chloroplastic/mitochondrial [Mucuna pruriens]
MANFVLQVPNTLRSFTVSASSNSNGALPGGSGSSSGGGGGPVILELPIDKIRRPLMRTRANDPNKVQELMDSIKEIGLQVPVVEGASGSNICIDNSIEKGNIDVLEVDGIYYGFSGCHRYEAHQRLGLPTIRCKIRRGTKETLRKALFFKSECGVLYRPLLTPKKG